MFKFKKITAKRITTLLTNHIYVFLLLPLVFISLPMLDPGVIMYGDFPLLETSLYSEKFLSTWVDFGSHHGFETLARYPIITMGVLLNSITIGGEIISKLLILLGFFTASFSFYFSCIILFRDKITSYEVFFKISTILGALFYAYNVWSFHRIHHWYLWLGYAALPLFVVLLVKSFKNPTKWKYVVATVMIWTIASSTPHMVIFYGIFYVGISLYFILRNITNRSALLRIVIPLTSIISFYLLLNLFWVYPYLMYTLYSGQGSLLPSILVTEELTRVLSRDNTFFNVVRLIQDWWEPRIIEVAPAQNSILYPVWLLASFVPSILAFSSLLVKRNSKIVLLFSAITLIGILLTLGTNAPFNLYSLILFESPLFTTLQFVFRDPDKWAFMIGLGYSFLLSISIFEILKKLNKSEYKNKALMSYTFISIILVSFVIYCYPTYSSTAQIVFDSVAIPTEYNQLNTYLQNKPIEKIFFMFQDFAPTIWHRQGEFYGFEQRYADKPNIMAYQYLPISENYHDYIQNSILFKKTNNVGNLIYPLGTSYLIYSNDELDENNTKLKLLSTSEDIKKITNIGFINVFKAGNNDVDEFNIPRQNILLSGGLDLFNSLNSLPSFTTLNSSLIFLDQSLNKAQKYRVFSFADNLSLGKRGDDLVLSFLDEKYILKPFEYTNHGDPSKMWSKDSALDIIHGQFHLYSKKLGVENWDFDYGKGLVMTDSTGANLSIPIDVGNKLDNIDTENSKLNIFVRYLQNQKGGQMNIYLDGKLINGIDTLNRISNNFVWKNIGSVSLTEAKHNLVLENTVGFNVVNLIAMVPNEQLEILRSKTIKMLGESTGIFYPMEVETQFYNNNATDINSVVLFRSNRSNVHDTPDTPEKTLSGQFKAPASSDYVVLEFLGQNVSNRDIQSFINDIEISPSSGILNIFSSDFEKDKNNVLKSDFDNKKVSILPENFSAFDWVNNQKDILSTSLETAANKKDFGNESLKVDIKQGNFSYWGTISTDFIPISENTSYGLSMDVSAKDVNQLHSKAYYFNSSDQEIKNELIFGAKDGTFSNAFRNTAMSPSGAQYMKLQLWVAPNPKMNSSYVLDNVKIEELKGLDWVNNQKDILSTSLETAANKKDFGNESLKVDIKQGNFSYWGTISTDFIPISDSAYYDYRFEVAAKDVNKLHSKIYYYDSLKNELSEDFAFDAKSGNFELSDKKSLLPPSGAKYLKLQYWVASNLKLNSSYFIDNVNLEEVIPLKDLRPDDDFDKLKNHYAVRDNYLIQDNNNVTEASTSSTGSLNDTSPYGYKMSTRLLPIQDSHDYNFTVTLNSEHNGSISAIATFKSSKDVTVNATKYGNDASNGVVLSLSPGSKIHSKLDIMRPSNYTVALRAKTCETCTYLLTNLTTENKNKFINDNNMKSNFSLSEKSSELKWLFSNSSFFLKEGSYELEIYSNSQTDLDSVIIYDIGSVDIFGKTRDTDDGNIFSPGVSTSPTISEFVKLSPTKYNLEIKNATQPFMLTFSESYDPQWIAYLSKDHTNESSIDKEDAIFKTGSVPLYSIVNGFYINKTGNYTLTVEYQPQEWFIQAGMASLIVLISALGILLFVRFLKNSAKIKPR